MRISILLFLSALVLSGHSQTIKLNFKPSRHIVKFVSDSATFYTDTNALYRANDDISELRDCRHVIRYYVEKEFAKYNTDTVTLIPSVISSLHDQFNYLTGENYVNSAISYLIKINKIKILDNHGQIVKSVIVKTANEVKMDRGTEIIEINLFLNKQTNRELYRQKMYCINRCPGNRLLD